jgi:uncharacterized protein DUF4158
MVFSPDDLETVLTAAMTFVAEQLQVSPAALRDYGARSQTRTEHLQQVQLHLGFRDATREDFSALADWLLTRALEHDKPSLLFQLACEHLRAKKMIRPGVTRIERLALKMLCVMRYTVPRKNVRLELFGNWAENGEGFRGRGVERKAASCKKLPKRQSESTSS